MLPITTRSRIVRHCYAAPSGGFLICVAVMHLTLRIGCERHGRKNPLPYPISERSHVGNLRRANKQGKGRSSKRKENRRLSFLFAHRRGYGVVPAAGAATLPPQRRRISRGGSAKNSPPRQGEPADAVRAPRLSGAGKGAAPSGRTRLRQFECPAQPVQKKVPPVRGEPACGSSCAPVSRCRKGAAR